MPPPDRETVRDLLERWRSGEANERAVREEAEQVLDKHGWVEYPEHDERSVALEVLSQVVILDRQLVTREDIPAMLGFLDTPVGEEPRGWAAWRSYWNGLDYGRRREELKNHPHYSA